MYSISGYIPKVDRNTLDCPIMTQSGVTQGRRSSVNLFSFLISEMATSIHSERKCDFIEPYNIAKLADDTVLVTENEISLVDKFQSLINFSESKFQLNNQSKTMYVHMLKFPCTQPIVCDNGLSIQALKEGELTTYIGMHLIHINSLQELICFNLDKRMFNIAKYKAWLEVNQNTISNKMIGS